MAVACPARVELSRRAACRGAGCVPYYGGGAVSAREREIYKALGPYGLGAGAGTGAAGAGAGAGTGKSPRHNPIIYNNKS